MHFLQRRGIGEDLLELGTPGLDQGRRLGARREGGVGHWRQKDRHERRPRGSREPWPPTPSISPTTTPHTVGPPSESHSQESKVTVRGPARKRLKSLSFH